MSEETIRTHSLKLDEVFLANKWLDEQVGYKIGRSRVWVNQETDRYVLEITFHDCPDVAILFKLTWG